MCVQQVCHLVLVVSAVAGNGYISEGEKRDFQSTSHLDQLSLSVQQSVSGRRSPGWLRPPPPARFRDMSYLGYHRLEHFLPPTPLPAANRSPLVPTLPSVRESLSRPNRTTSKSGGNKGQEAVTASLGDPGTHSRKGAASMKDGNRNSTPTKKEHVEVISESGTHIRKGAASGKDGNRNSTPTKKEHVEVISESGTHSRRGAASERDGSRNSTATKKERVEVISESGTHSRRGAASGKDGSRNSTPTKKEHVEVISESGTKSRQGGTKKEHLEVSESAHEPSYAPHGGYPAGGGGASTGRVRIQVYRGPTKKVGYKYFAPWGFYVSQPSDNNKHSSYGYY